ncbi:MAG: discoidin domain-containing protein [Spirochaetes bacterium]|nr:discoidin domain-containing protein [Spirochaetota bacterium]
MKYLIILINLFLLSSPIIADNIWDLRKIAVDAKASSDEQDNNTKKAFDFDFGTRWSSKFDDNQWIYIDLGKICKITEIKLVWETAYAKKYKLEISNDLNDWKTIKYIKDGKGGEESFQFSDIKARYIRMYGIKRATSWGFSLYEFIIKGPHKGNETEHGGLVVPGTQITIYDHNWKELDKYFAEQLANDPVDSKNLTDDQFLDLIEKRAFEFFWNEVHPESLFVVDSTTWKTHTSVAGIGMQLAAYIIGHYRKYREPNIIYKRVEKLLNNCFDDPNDPNDLCLEHHEGWTYHWVNIKTGIWEQHEHVCTHDSIMYICGVITAKHYFAGTKAGDIAAKIIDSIDWAWIIHGGRNKRFVSNCYSYIYEQDNNPCGGDVRFYDGMKFDYLLPIGGIKSSVPPEYWHNYAQDFPWDSYKGHYWRIQRPALWIHQWDNLWFDFKYMKDDYTNYHQNSVEATLANRQWSLDQGWYDENLWGINPCLGPGEQGGCHYKDYGAPQDDLPFQKGGDNDYTISTTAAIPCIVFTPKESIRVARYIYDNYKDKIWKKYGFTDSLNPEKNWFCKEYIGIDIGPIIINLENYRSGLIYKYFSKEPIVWNGFSRSGFVGIIDDFDESEHSPAYAQWFTSDKKCFILKRNKEYVKEAKNSLLIKYNYPAGKYFYVKPKRKDFSHYKYLAFWLKNDNQIELNIKLLTEDGKIYTLKKETVIKSYDNWSYWYFNLPIVKNKEIKEIRFYVNSEKKGKLYLDDVVLNDKIEKKKPDFIIEDFEQDFKHSWITSRNIDVKVTSDKTYQGKKSLKVKAGEEPSFIKISFETPQDLRKFHSIVIHAYGLADITVRLRDKFGKSFKVAKKNSSRGKWNHLFFNIQGTLNPSNCWELRYDKKYITEMQINFQNADKVYLDYIALTE